MTVTAAEVRLRAERRVGELLERTERNHGGQAEHEAYRSHDATTRTPTLSDLGVTRSALSRHWQSYANLPFEHWERTGIAAQVTPGRWALTNAGAAMFAGWIDLTDNDGEWPA